VSFGVGLTIDVSGLSRPHAQNINVFQLRICRMYSQGSYIASLSRK
jgi:hypothetical protein